MFGDIVRVDLTHRPFAKAGNVVRIRHGKHLARAVARGTPTRGKATISLDSSTRERLHLKSNSTATLIFERANLIDEFLWAWNATDAMPRIASRLGLISVLLGLLGLMLGALSLAH